MDKCFFRQCIKEEVYGPYKQAKGRLTFFDKIWCRYISPELNSVYLVRKKQYFESKGRIGRILSRLYHVKLMRRYGIHITEGVIIGVGLRIAHPSSITVTFCHIGNCFTIYQNCTIGQKRPKSGLFPTIGNNVTMFAGSMVIGQINVVDNVVLGANSTLTRDALQEGIYVGTPARLLKKDNNEVFF